MTPPLPRPFPSATPPQQLPHASPDDDGHLQGWKVPGYAPPEDSVEVTRGRRIPNLLCNIKANISIAKCESQMEL